MGCNTCKEKALRAERERIERSMMNRPSSTVVSDREYASRSTAGCMVMQDPLQTMERDVVSIYKQVRTRVMALAYLILICRKRSVSGSRTCHMDARLTRRYRK